MREGKRKRRQRREMESSKDGGKDEGPSLLSVGKKSLLYSDWPTH